MRHKNFGLANNLGILGACLALNFWWVILAILLIVVFPWLSILVGVIVATVVVVYMATKPPPEALVVKATSDVPTEQPTVTNTYVIGNIYYFSINGNTWQKMQLVGFSEDGCYYAEVPLPHATTVFKYKHIKEKF